MTDWFRSWHGAPTDPKWLGIARKAGVAPGIAVAVAWALMDRASQADDRGSIIGYDADGLACFFGCEPEQVDAIVAAMEDKGVVSDGRLASWEKRQPKREETSTQRVREHRERAKSQVERTETQCNAPEKSREETDISEPIGSSAAAPPEDPVARLFSDGLTDLMSLGLKEPQARRMLGKWRKDAGDDCGRVLAAIARARERCVSDPIPFVTAALSGGQNGASPRNPQQHPLNLAFDRLAEHARRMEDADRVEGGRPS